jgi:thiamine biosynthesis lipoprotein
VDANTAATAAIVRAEEAPHWLRHHRLPARLVRIDGSVLTVGGWPPDPVPGD